MNRLKILLTLLVSTLLLLVILGCKSTKHVHSQQNYKRCDCGR